jgi:hypothetical protein
MAKQIYYAVIATAPVVVYWLEVGKTYHQHGSMCCRGEIISITIRFLYCFNGALYRLRRQGAGALHGGRQDFSR